MRTDPEGFAQDMPLDSATLIETLDRLHPHRCLSVGENIDAHREYAGARALIDSLLEWKRFTLAGEDDPGSL